MHLRVPCNVPFMHRTSGNLVHIFLKWPVLIYGWQTVVFSQLESRSPRCMYETQTVEHMLWACWVISPQCRIYASVYRVSMGSDNSLSPGRRQAIIWTNAGILLIGPLGINFSDANNRNHYIFIHENAFENVVCEMAAILSGGNELTHLSWTIWPPFRRRYFQRHFC